ncbi:MAG: hypothetical protein KDD44_04695 [Bdellovibrionales bacterium]|nr:hypothetical protein [Bdellovibrionales bacterium]
MEFATIVILVAIAYSAWLNHISPLPALAALLLFVLILLYHAKQRQRRSDFVDQLRSHRTELRQGGTVVVDGQLIRYDTPLTTYHVSVGVIVSTLQIPSLYRVAVGEDHVESFAYSVLSLATGWWSFPYGPLTTIGVIGRNLAGGDRTTAGYLIDEILFKREQKKLEAAPRSERAGAKPVTSQVRPMDSGTSPRIEERPPSILERVSEYENPTPPGTKALRKFQSKLRDFGERKRAHAAVRRKKSEHKDSEQSQ